MRDSLQLSIQLRQMFNILLFIVSIVFCVSTTLAISLNSSTITHVSTSKQQGLVLNLIHRDLIHPPTYPRGSTLLDRIDLALSRVARKSHLNNNENGMSSSNSKANINQTSIGFIKNGGNLFHVIISIGSKNVRQYAALDTGSDLIWVQCAGYDKGHKTANPVYDPSKSSSYHPSTCLPPKGAYCKKVPGGDCDNLKRCKYSVKYLDGSHYNGFIGFDTITFHKADRRTPSPITNVLFGCGMENDKEGNKLEDGVFGIGGDTPELSILEKTGKQFSFCIGNIKDASYEFNHLALGVDANFKGVYVPFSMNKGKYYVDLKWIAVGTHKIPTGDRLSVLIDLGSTLSFLKKDIQAQLSGMVEHTIGRRMEKVNTPSYPNLLCYKGPIHIKDFPNVDLVLGPKTHIRMDINTLFWKIPGENVFCLAILPSSSHDIIGAMALQYHNVGFNLRTRQAYFDRVLRCDKILQN